VLVSLNRIKGVIYDNLDLIRGSGLKAKIARGAVLLCAGTVTDRGLKFIRNMILARILAPGDFGLMAIVMIVPTVFEMFTQIGVSHSVIQNKRGAEREYLNVAWWVQAIQGLGLFIIGVFLAPLVSSFYDKPELLNLLRVAFLAILFRGLISPRINVLRKEFKYGRFVLLSQGSGILGTFIVIGLAFVIRNIWALVIGFVAEAAILCLLSYAFVPFLPSFRIDRDSLFELVRFVRRFLGSPILVFIATRTDVVVLGKLVIEDRLGMYSLAMHLAYLPVILFDCIIRPLLLPAFSEKQDDKVAICRVFLKISRGGAVFGLSLIAFMASCASEILLLAYGPKYSAVSVPFAVLSTCALVRIHSGISVPVYTAIGEQHLVRRFITLQTVIVVVLIYPAILMFDLTGAASLILLANVITLCFEVLCLKKLIGLQFLEYVRCWLPGLLAGSLVLVSAALVKVFGIRSAVCNVSVVGLSCVTSCVLVLFFLKSKKPGSSCMPMILRD